MNDRVYSKLCICTHRLFFSVRACVQRISPTRRTYARTQTKQMSRNTSMQATFAIFDDEDIDDETREHNGPPRVTPAKRAAAHVTGGLKSPSRRDYRAPAVLFASDSDSDEDADAEETAAADDAEIIFPGRRSFAPSGGAPPRQPYEQARDVGLARDPAYENAMRRQQPARPEGAYDPEVQRAVTARLDSDPLYAFARKVAGKLGQSSSSPFIENETELTQRVAQYVADTRQQIRMIDDKIDKSEKNLQDLTARMHSNDKNVQTLLSQQMPQINIVSPDAALVQNVIVYVNWLDDKVTRKRRAEPPAIDIITTVSTWLDDLVAALGVLGGIGPDGAGAGRGADTLNDLTAFLAAFRRAIAFSDVDTPHIHPPGSAQDNSFTIDIPWLVAGAPRFLRVVLDAPGRETIVSREARASESGTPYRDTLGAEQPKYSVVDAARAIQAARSALASIVRVSENMVLRPADISRAAGSDISNFALEVVAARILQYDPAAHAAAEKYRPGLSARALVTRANRELVNNFVTTLIMGTSLAELANRILSDLPNADDSRHFTWESGFATRAAMHIALLGLVSTGEPATMEQLKTYLELLTYDDIRTRIDATWKNAIRLDPRLALARFYIRYTIVRLYVTELIDQIVRGPDASAMLELQKEHQKLTSEEASLRSRLIEFSGDRLLGGARRAFDPYISGVLRLSAQLLAAIASAETFIHEYGPTGFENFSINDYILGSDGQPPDNSGVARDFYNLLADLVAFKVREVNKSGFVTSITATLQTTAQKDILQRLQNFAHVYGQIQRSR